MGKILLLAIAVWLLLSVLKRYRSSLDSTPPAAQSTEDMVQCAHCGVHLPKSDSILAGEQRYCSETHAREHRHGQ